MAGSFSVRAEALDPYGYWRGELNYKCSTVLEVDKYECPTNTGRAESCISKLNVVVLYYKYGWRRLE